MLGLFLIAKVIFYLVVVTWALFFFKRRVGVVKSLLITLLLATIPWWDLYPRWFKHQELCNLDGGYRVYNTVPEGVESYYDSGYNTSFSWELENYKYVFIEGHTLKDGAQVYRFSLNKVGLAEKTKIVTPVSQYEYFREFLDERLPYGLTGSRSGIKDRETGELLASITNYVIKRPWGWYFSFPDKGKGCVKITGKLKPSLFFSEIIPPKRLLRD